MSLLGAGFSAELQKPGEGVGRVRKEPGLDFGHETDGG
jgi:hypothetical protein